MVTLYSIFQSFIKQTKIYIQSVLPKKVSELTNDAGYLTSHQDISGKQDKLTFDTTPTANSTNPVTSSGIKNAIDNLNADMGDFALGINNSFARKEDVKVKGVKLAGATSSLTPDTNGVVTIPNPDLSEYAKVSDLNSYQTKLKFDMIPTAGSFNPVTSAGVNSYVNGLADSISNTYATKDDLDTKLDKTGGTATGPITAPSFIGNLSGNADTATKATQDGDGNVITDTYAKKTDLSNYVTGYDVSATLAQYAKKSDVPAITVSGNTISFGGVTIGVD